MRSFDDSDELAPDERLSAIAGILAAGILRLQCRSALAAAAAESENPANSVAAGLEVSGETKLSVHAG
ncbi:MAG TPA: hypothetical protein VG826_00675 [Pirellulales bacterium]|nr:hypothetical protein [Pirellulales bacterium]